MGALQRMAPSSAGPRLSSLVVTGGVRSASWPQSRSQGRGPYSLPGASIQVRQRGTPTDDCACRQRTLQGRSRSGSADLSVPCCYADSRLGVFHDGVRARSAVLPPRDEFDPVAVVLAVFRGNWAFWCSSCPLYRYVLVLSSPLKLVMEPFESRMDTFFSSSVLLHPDEKLTQHLSATG